jgi:gamma-glutamyltranspeptidase/glutathione hydrolase
MLKILEGDAIAQTDWHSAATAHRFFAAMLFAYADRNIFLGDPAFVQNPVEHLLSPAYIASILDRIPAERAIPPESLYGDLLKPEGERENTTHYSVHDRTGNSVAVTYTINSFFGAGVIAGQTGFFLNNEMDDFTAKLGQPNNFGLVQLKC